MATPLDQVESIANAGHRTAQAGGLTTLVGWFTSSEAGVVIGIVIGFLGLAIQLYYRRKQNKREEDEHKLRMTLLQDGYEARAALDEESRK